MEVSSFGIPGGLKTLRSSPDVISAGYLGMAVGGILVGALQWLVLRGHVARAGRWVLASLGAAAVGMPLGESFGWLALGAAYGAITGTALVWLLRQRYHTE